MPEEWKPVPGFPKYQVSDTGRIVSYHRPVPRELKRRRHMDGYWLIQLWDGGKATDRTVHSVVAEAFLGPRPEGLEVRHLNGDPADSRVSNLAYGTHQQNMIDRSLHGRHWQARKTRCKNGHTFTPENTGRNSRDGHRFCKICAKGSHARSRARRTAHKAGAR